MKKPLTAILALLVPAFLPTAAHALDWKQDRIEIKASAVDEQAAGVFRFTNNSEKTVTITTIHSSCGCTVPALEKRTYAPGESGEVKAVFSFGGRTGLQVKTITVQTDEPGNAAYRLTLQVDIPKLFSVDRHFVIWRRGDETTAKKIVVTAHDPDTAQVVGVESADARVTAELKTSDNPQTHDVLIAVADTAKALQAPVVIKTNFPADNPRVITVYALVR